MIRILLMFARSFASYRLKMHLTVEAIEEKPLIFLHSKRAITSSQTE